MPPLIQPALPAAKNLVGDEAIYYLLARPALRRQFHSIRYQQIGPLPQPQEGPVIFFLNHSSWWDGYMMMLTHRRIFGRRLEGYLLMEEQQLRAYRFFTWCGAFSINRNDPLDTERSLTYITNLLRERHNRALYIFPQGRIVHNDLRPIQIFPGIARIIAQVGAVLLCPIVYRYEYGGRQSGTAYIRVGPARRAQHSPDPDQLLAGISADLTNASDALREQVVAGDLSRLGLLMRGQAGIDERFDLLLRLWRRGVSRLHQAPSAPAGARTSRRSERP